MLYTETLKVILMFNFFFSITGGFIWKDLSEGIIKDHLAASVPSSNSQVCV